jgi:Flp pilus assembly protein TadB
MTAPAKWAVCLLLFVLSYVAVSRLLAAVLGGKPVRGRFAFRRRSGFAAFGYASRAGGAGRDALRRFGSPGSGLHRWSGEAGSGTGRGGIPGYGVAAKPFKPTGRSSLAEMLVSAEAGLSPTGFAVLSVIAGCAGFAGGAVLLGSAKGTLVSAGLLMLLPSLWLRSRLASRQLKRRKDLLPALESFYQGYVLSPGRNVRVAIRHAAHSGRLPRHAQTVFERLNAELTVGRNPSDSLRLFAASFASRWADLFTSLIGTALDDGTDIAEGLRELIADMRRARRNDQAERNRLLEIRMASFSPLLFLAVFLAVNFRMDPDMARRHYLLSDTGKEMLLDAFVLIALSFMMGVWLSLRKE